MTKVLVIGDARKGGTREVLDDFEPWLRQQVDAVQVILDRDASLAQNDADLVLVVGGDGSILGAARRMGDNQKPTLGINLGRLGFLTACRKEQAREVVAAALSGKLNEEERMMLACHVERANGERTEPVLALNDGVLNRRSRAGIVSIVARRGTAELAAYSGDGLIVATPTGSTAYSLASGGPVLAPEMEAVVLTPLASHSLALRPLVVPLGEGLDLLVTEESGTGSCPFVIDGQVSLDVPVGDRVCLRPTSTRFRHLSLGPDNFYKVFREKFGWADLPRLRD